MNKDVGCFIRKQTDGEGGHVIGETAVKVNRHYHPL